MKVRKITNLFRHNKPRKINPKQTIQQSREEFLKLPKEQQDKIMLDEHLRLYANEKLGCYLPESKAPWQKYVHYSKIVESAMNKVLEKMGYGN